MCGCADENQREWGKKCFNGLICGCADNNKRTGRRNVLMDSKL